MKYYNLPRNLLMTCCFFGGLKALAFNISNIFEHVWTCCAYVRMRLWNKHVPKIWWFTDIVCIILSKILPFVYPCVYRYADITQTFPSFSPWYSHLGVYWQWLTFFPDCGSIGVRRCWQVRKVFRPFFFPRNSKKGIFYPMIIQHSYENHPCSLVKIGIRP